MMEFEDFKRLADEIQSQGYDRATAVDLASWIGDTPILDQRGRIVVRDVHGKELARLRPLKFFESE
jgi:hypothetical protein